MSTQSVPQNSVHPEEDFPSIPESALEDSFLNPVLADGARGGLGVARRRWKATEDAWTEEYLRLRDEGQGHREALRIIRGPVPHGEQPQITVVEMAVQAGLARRTRRARDARDADIRRLAAEGRTRQAISDTLRIPYRIVLRGLKKASVPVRDARHDRRGAVGAPKA